ncbi:uncharacterized protein BHQ10_009803 [Talaromyces amestolkiae]|uniref:Holocytochrome c-type synthase n=1 Tax=Talaromyces amestolkiae TaxID=1196081 RepID=A0A364LDK1_TALAM|nr:uncharacterized protein BHQ10_009803 [Talaromyces amestolkiae]RAO73791.1 hypothetical protein BHQ10_009803 [Talaromyces amestolkiae]
MATKAAHKRLTREYQNIQKNPPPYIVAHPSETNILEWHYILTGPPKTPYENGQYWGTLIFPPEYPFAPPAIRMHTPSGRFQPSTRLCLSISDFHPKSFNPAWEVSTILIGLLSFMTSEEMTTGSVSASDSERRLFAARSRWWNSTGGGSQTNIPAGVTATSKGINNIKAGDGGLKFRTEWPELDQENWRWIKDNRIDAATGHIIPDPNALTSNHCSPETSALRRRPAGSGPRLGAVMEDSQRPAAVPVAAANTTSAAPPPACPMHKAGASSAFEAPVPSACPVKRSPNSPFFVPPSESQPQQQSQEQAAPNTSGKSRINPLNYMFSFISQERAPSQTVDLPVEREISSIPRADNTDEKWEYPSPQQMYNAMLRKGYTDTPQDAVESMVAVHNFLNEGAWAEIVEWEQIFSKGLKSGWEKCRKGNEKLAVELAKERWLCEQRSEEEKLQPCLVRFQGRPQELSPKARFMQTLGWLYPAKFGTEPPFDRHDWYISRQTPSGPKEVRYVIDYYSGPPEPTGEPVFFLDIRPAVDTPTAAVERLMRWGGDVWYRASGAQVREKQ